ncbi:MAG: FlgD immunoglobulin-like domain containing protein [Candidatus Eisenbacteria bacterium]|nr:FlgD immunoglobulin-like domain containing protein [Candidatus Eisenbacteria bacterium]
MFSFRPLQFQHKNTSILIPVMAMKPEQATENERFRSWPGKSSIRLTLHDAYGRRILTLVDGVRPAGTYSVSWNGRNENGTKLPSGVYLATLQSGVEVRTRKVVILR